MFGGKVQRHAYDAFDFFMYIARQQHLLQPSFKVEYPLMHAPGTAATLPYKHPAGRMKQGS